MRDLLSPFGVIKLLVLFSAASLCHSEEGQFFPEDIKVHLSGVQSQKNLDLEERCCMFLEGLSKSVYNKRIKGCRLFEAAIKHFGERAPSDSDKKYPFMVNLRQCFEECEKNSVKPNDRTQTPSLTLEHFLTETSPRINSPELKPVLGLEAKDGQAEEYSEVAVKALEELEIYMKLGIELNMKVSALIQENNYLRFQLELERSKKVAKEISSQGSSRAEIGPEEISPAENSPTEISPPDISSEANAKEGKKASLASRLGKLFKYLTPGSSKSKVKEGKD